MTIARALGTPASVVAVGQGAVHLIEAAFTLNFKKAAVAGTELLAGGIGLATGGALSPTAACATTLLDVAAQRIDAKDKGGKK